MKLPINRPTDHSGGGEVVDLLARRTERDDLAFGARIAKSGLKNLAANEQMSGLLSRLVIDESLPYYVAALDGTVMHFNDHYQMLDEALGDVTLSAGPASVGPGMRVPGLVKIIEDVLASEQTVRSEEAAVTQRSNRVFLGRHMPVRNEAGNIIAAAGTYEDVTLQVRGIEEVSKAQARFQDFTRASSDWFFECDADLKIKTLSERFTALVGYPAQLFIGSAFDQVGMFSENIDGRLDGLKAIDNRKPFRDLLFVMKSGSGVELKFHLAAVPIFERHTGEFQGYRGVGMDVTTRYDQDDEARRIRGNLEQLLQELTRKNIALDDAHEQVKTALKSKNEFLATMSHELRTPLNAIIGFADSFSVEAFGTLGEKYREYAHDIGNSGRHLLGLINDILDVAVIESGGLNLYVQPVLLEQIVEKSVNMNLEAAVQKTLNVEALALASQTWVVADERRLMQVFVNLISNAIKFTPEGGKLGIDLCINEDEQMARLTVWDTGVGISVENLDRIFDKFHQITDDVYSRKQEGTGLGLHISKELSQGMGGDLTVESTEGEGSRFTVSIPLDQGCVDDESDFI